MRLQSIFIVSVPRSGSTVLTNLLDQHEDVICPPESFFPAVLDFLGNDEMTETRKIAAIFVGSCSDGSPLTIDEAEKCILPDKYQTLEALALAIAAKNGRDPAQIRIMVWKFTRMVGRWRFAATAGGRFIILRRDPLNVYESQFRVHFGLKNRNPFRFALFAASYEVAFKDYPSDQVLTLEYPEIPTRLEEISEWIGSKGKHREHANSHLEEIAKQNPWHSNITKPFENKDSEKIQNLTALQCTQLRAGMAVLKHLSAATRPARQIADKRQMSALLNQAAHLLQNS